MKSRGGADRDRTDDIQLAKLALSQLSYGPIRSGGRLRLPPVPPASAAREPRGTSSAAKKRRACRYVGLDRFELSTPRLSSVCSNQLSYRPLPSPGSYGPESPPSEIKDPKVALRSLRTGQQAHADIAAPRVPGREPRALTCRCRARFRVR